MCQSIISPFLGVKMNYELTGVFPCGFEHLLMLTGGSVGFQLLTTTVPPTGTAFNLESPIAEAQDSQLN